VGGIASTPIKNASTKPDQRTTFTMWSVRQVHDFLNMLPTSRYEHTVMLTWATTTHSLTEKRGALSISTLGKALCTDKVRCRKQQHRRGSRYVHISSSISPHTPSSPRMIEFKKAMLRADSQHARVNNEDRRRWQLQMPLKLPFRSLSFRRWLNFSSLFSFLCWRCFLC
jgi:hypothetical protein